MENEMKTTTMGYMGFRVEGLGLRVPEPWTPCKFFHTAKQGRCFSEQSIR